MSDEVVISVKNITKTYQLYNSHADRVKEALHPFRKKYHHAFYALQDVSFDVHKGEAVGVIGRNGCGKSTLLQIVCGILKPTAGTVEVKGRISALLELGAGFNPEYTGRQNVYLNGAILGFSKAEMDARFDKIVDFADIGEFIDQPVKTYSSGMYVRLAFAVQVCVDPDVLIVDEALSVGDVFFQQKCFARIREIIAKGTTCLFVSHDTIAVQNLCQRACLLQKGQVVFLGDAQEAVSRYFGTIGEKPGVKTQTYPEDRPSIKPIDVFVSNDFYDVERILEHNILQHSTHRHGTRGIELLAARVTDNLGRDTMQVEMLQHLIFSLLLQANEAIVEPSAGIHLFDRLGNLVFAAGTRQLGIHLPDLADGEQMIVILKLALNVQPGEYTFSLGTSEPSTDHNPNIGYVQDRHEQLGPLVVTADATQIFPFYGIAQLPMKIEYRKIDDGM
ncbi:ABC transporter protein abcA [Candidatus Vecturithrix granuli]|uniref:ABC transporter protein abcA n=1 Tax=Vecturithrix granuli TaxID=1499967 RepID=A0A081BW80_VECG1|nr:ABC transporter protein abcA [Candidatus Vecturithrix granuli]